MIDLGTKAPSFSLPNVTDQKMMSLDDIRGKKGTLIIFMCNHCPFVIHLMDEMVKMCKEYQDNGFGVVAISSNDVMNYPQDSPGKMAILSEELEFTFPYLYDETQEVAKAYDAACTPDFYVYDNADILTYRGRMDQSRPGNDKPIDGADLRQVMNLMVAGDTVSDVQYPSAGCNIKWKK